jgi:Protein of unknown function (DUF3147)
MPVDDAGRDRFFLLRGLSELGAAAVPFVGPDDRSCTDAGLVRRIVRTMADPGAFFMRKIEIDFSSLKDTKPSAYALRAVFGGLCTVVAGLIAHRYGAAVGGLFLAFPAIFPASASLIEDHEIEQKQKIGSDGRKRGRMAASLDATGASLGCLGLLGFAWVLWKLLPNKNGYVAISTGVIFWAFISCTLWMIRRSKPFRGKVR